MFCVSSLRGFEVNLGDTSLLNFLVRLQTIWKFSLFSLNKILLKIIKLNAVFKQIIFFLIFIYSLSFSILLRKGNQGTFIWFPLFFLQSVSYL